MSSFGPASASPAAQPSAQQPAQQQPAQQPDLMAEQGAANKDVVDAYSSVDARLVNARTCINMLMAGKATLNESRAALADLQEFCSCCMRTEEVSAAAAVWCNNIYTKLKAGQDSVYGAGIAVHLTQQQENDLRNLNQALQDYLDTVNASKVDISDGFSSFTDIYAHITILIRRYDDAIKKAAMVGGGGGGASRKGSFFPLDDEADVEEEAFCPIKTSMPRAAARLADAIRVRTPKDKVLTMAAMLGRQGNDLTRIAMELKITATMSRDQPAAAAAAVAAAAVVASNSIPKLLENSDLMMNATDLGKLNVQSASCAVQLATPAIDAVDRIQLLKGRMGSLEFSLKPGCWLHLKIATLVKDKGWRWFLARLTSLEVLNSAYDGGLRGRFPSVLKMAAAFEDYKMGIVTISVGQVTALKFVDAEPGAAALPAVPPPPSIDAAAGGPSSIGSTGYCPPRGGISSGVPPQGMSSAGGSGGMRSAGPCGGISSSAPHGMSSAGPSGGISSSAPHGMSSAGPSGGISSSAPHGMRSAGPSGGISSSAPHGMRSAGPSGGISSSAPHGMNSAGGSGDISSGGAAGAAIGGGSSSSACGKSAFKPPYEVGDLTSVVVKVVGASAAAAADTAAAAPSGGGGLECDVEGMDGDLKGHHTRLTVAVDVGGLLAAGKVAGRADMKVSKIITFKAAAAPTDADAV